MHLEERPLGPPGTGQVAIELRTAALNRLDLWVASGAQRVKPPRVLGADGAGVVTASDSHRWKVGDEVVVFPSLCCWECDACRSGQQVLCPDFGILGEDEDGSACQRLLVPARNVFSKPGNLTWPEAAAFPLTFLTAWRMLVTRARLRAGETLLVVGVGAGVGVAALVLGLHLGARVMVTSRSPQTRRRALAMGAEAAFDSASFWQEARDKSGGGVDVVFEHVGPATLDQSLRSLVRGGRLTLCGSTSGVRAEIGLPRVFLNQIEILGSTMGNAGEFRAVLDAVEGGAKPVVDSIHPLREVTGALQRLEQTDHFGKVVLEIPS